MKILANETNGNLFFFLVCFLLLFVLPTTSAFQKLSILIYLMAAQIVINIVPSTLLMPILSNYIQSKTNRQKKNVEKIDCKNGFKNGATN